MAVVLKLGGLNPADVHVVASPLTELMAVLHALAEPDHHLEASAVLARIAGSLDPATVDEFRALSPLWARFRCRIFFPLGAQSGSLSQQLQAVLELSLIDFVRVIAEGIHGYARPLPAPELLLTDPQAQRTFLNYCRTRSTSRLELAEALLADPHAFRRRLVAFLGRAQELFFHDEWSRVHEPIRQSLARTDAGLRATGPMDVLAQLSVTATVHPHLTIKDTPGFSVVIHFPAHAVHEERLGLRQVRERLAALASEARMEIVRHLAAEPITTSALALRLDQNPAQVSRSLGVLREAGLLVSERRGKLVYHRLNTDRMLDLGKDIRATLVR